MVDKQAITIELPPYLYEFLHKFSEQSGQPIEKLLLESIERSYLGRDYAEIERLFENLSSATDDELWWVLHQTFLWLRGLQLEEWLERAEPLTETERAYVDTLLEQYNRYVMARSQALLYLKQRGHDVDAYLAAVEQFLSDEAAA